MLNRHSNNSSATADRVVRASMYALSGAVLGVGGTRALQEAGLRRLHATAWTYLFGMIKSLSSSTTTTVPPRQKRRLKRQQREEEEEFRVHDPKISHP